MSAESTSPRKLWAVVANGTLLPNGLPKFLNDKDGNVYPLPIYFHEDKSKAERRLKSLETRFRQIRKYGDPSMIPSRPFLGLVEVEFPAKKAGRKISQEQKDAMQAARKNKDKPTQAQKQPAGAK